MALEDKLQAITCRSSMGVHLMWDDGIVQITLRDNDYIKCSGDKPYYSGWHATIEGAANAVLEEMDKVMFSIYGDDCVRIFRQLLDA